MSIPSATYRVQFRNEMTFDRAIDLIPHLTSLGISHLYASPIFKATEGSTHGYDVVDANEIEAAIGGREGFERLVSALRQAGIGLILDIVPNHMAASVENPWWRDVLRNGSRSAYAPHFDIDWSRKITLPVLGKPLEAALSAGEVRVVRDASDGAFNLAYFETLFPLNDESVRYGLSKRFNNPVELDAFSRDQKAMMMLLEDQHWMLLHWKDAAARLSYRRFFEVTGLVGVRVEDESVFQDSHRLVLDLVRSGQVQGLRIDHVDGLADPATYLKRLRDAVGPQIYIVVEKILGPSEALPSTWPVSGTTGYEFISALSGLFVDPEGLRKLQDAYSAADAASADFDGGLKRAKKLMVERNFEGEVTRLVNIAQALAPHLAQDAIRAALQALLIAFPVYRTYGYRGPLGKQDDVVLSKVAEQARSHLEENDAVDLMARLVRGEIDGDPAFEFRARFQQLSGPVMAKAMEDTLFYRHNRLIAANEVGGEPNAEPRGVVGFHAAMIERRKTQPGGFSATSTHDTKRGEDARARLYTLSEGADDWLDGLKRWQAMNARALTALPDGPAPERNMEWMLYQALAGVWPQKIEKEELKALGDRFTAYVEKAVREAKLRTDWSDKNEDYEKAVLAYAAHLVSVDNRQFLDDFGETLKPFLDAGEMNSLAQTAIKLTAPGVPDIYQGTQGIDLSLVDPDNRRPVDYGAFFADVSADVGDGGQSLLQRKIGLIRAVIPFRREHPKLFSEGDYVPLAVSGLRRAHVVAFARALEGQQAIVIVPRSLYGQIDPRSHRVLAEFWGDTEIEIPQPFRRPMRNLLSGRSFHGNVITVSEVLSDQSVGVLVTA